MKFDIHLPYIRHMIRTLIALLLLTPVCLSQDRIDKFYTEAQKFCNNNNYSTNLIILADMSLHSGMKRLYIYENDTLVSTEMVSHGCCQNMWGEDETSKDPTFSNVPESHCSSLGKYKIGQRGYSNWGIHVNYKLHGLETTNSNAYNRIIVLHSWDKVPNEQVYPDGTPEGWGCPAVSNDCMKKLDLKLKKEKKPVLLWVFD